MRIWERGRGKSKLNKQTYMLTFIYEQTVQYNKALWES